MPKSPYKKQIIALLNSPIPPTLNEIAKQVGCTIDGVKYYTRKNFKRKSLSLSARLKKFNITEEEFNKTAPRDPITSQYLCHVSGFSIELDKDKWAVRQDKKTGKPFVFLMRYSAFLSYTEEELVKWAKGVLLDLGYKIEEQKD